MEGTELLAVPVRDIMHRRPPETDREVTRKLTVIDVPSWSKVLSIMAVFVAEQQRRQPCLLYTSPSPRDS